MLPTSASWRLDASCGWITHAMHDHDPPEQIQTPAADSTPIWPVLVLSVPFLFLWVTESMMESIRMGTATGKAKVSWALPQV